VFRVRLIRSRSSWPGSPCGTAKATGGGLSGNFDLFKEGDVAGVDVKQTRSFVLAIVALAVGRGNSHAPLGQREPHRVRGVHSAGEDRGMVGETSGARLETEAALCVSAA
jgi:hypothetical protein